MANRFGKPQKKKRIGETLGWLFKAFLPMYQFMVARFQKYPLQKGRVQYNDPWLEMFRFLHGHRLAAHGGLPRTDKSAKRTTLFPRPASPEALLNNCSYCSSRIIVEIGVKPCGRRSLLGQELFALRSARRDC
jgi:hypothetical protein